MSAVPTEKAPIVIEQFRDIPGHDGYQAGEFGTIRSVDRTILTIGRWGGIVERKLKGRVIRPYRCGNYLGLRFGKDEPNRYVHQLVASAWLPEDSTP